MSKSARSCNVLSMPLQILMDPSMIKIQVEVLGWAKDILAIPA